MKHSPMAFLRIVAINSQQGKGRSEKPVVCTPNVTTAEFLRFFKRLKRLSSGVDSALPLISLRFTKECLSTPPWS